MAKNYKDKEKFIELRAEGLSFEKISKQLKISKPTLMRWEKELIKEIEELNFIQFESLKELFSMNKKQRIKRLGNYLTNIYKEIEKRNLDNVPTAKLFELYFTISEKIKYEFEGITCESMEKTRSIKFDNSQKPKYVWDLYD